MSESKGSSGNSNLSVSSEMSSATSSMSSAEMLANGIKGVVKWFNDAKGFGFIEHTTGRDVFVHYSVIQQEGFKTLEDGEEVVYEVKEGPKGLHAVRVDRVNFKPEDATAEAASASPASTEQLKEISSDLETKESQ